MKLTAEITKDTVGSSEKRNTNIASQGSTPIAKMTAKVIRAQFLPAEIFRLRNAMNATEHSKTITMKGKYCVGVDTALTRLDAEPPRMPIQSKLTAIATFLGFSNLTDSIRLVDLLVVVFHPAKAGVNIMAGNVVRFK